MTIPDFYLLCVFNAKGAYQIKSPLILSKNNAKIAQQTLTFFQSVSASLTLAHICFTRSLEGGKV